MKKYTLLLLLIACQTKTTDEVLAPQDFQMKFSATADALLLDVRTEEEVAAGKIHNAKNIVYDDAFATKLDTLSRRPIFVYCGSGIRSAKAAKILREKGFEEVYECAGGLKTWKEAGLPVE